VRNLGALQTMLAWAEDRALLRSTPSADPGAKTGTRAERHRSALDSHAEKQQLRDWHRSDKPSRHDVATSGTGCRPALTYANRAKFHFTVNQDSRPRVLQDLFPATRNDGGPQLEHRFCIPLSPEDAVALQPKVNHPPDGALDCTAAYRHTPASETVVPQSPRVVVFGSS
jgi:hypothetical protein